MKSEILGCGSIIGIFSIKHSMVKLDILPMTLEAYACVFYDIIKELGYSFFILGSNSNVFPKHPQHILYFIKLNACMREKISIPMGSLDQCNLCEI